MRSLVRSGLVVMASFWAAVAVASSNSAGEDASTHEIVMKSSVGGGDTLHLTIMQVFFPGLPERAGCRMQVIARNDGTSRVSMRALVNTFDEAKGAVDTWLVPTGDLKPGEEVLRVYSCRTAHDVAVSEASPYGWPQTCTVNGADTSPCPLTLKVSTSISLPAAKGDKEGKKGGH